MTWLKCYKGVDRETVNSCLKNCRLQNGVVSISTTFEASCIKLTFNKFHGVDNAEFNEIVGFIVAYFKILELVEDYKINELTV
ncbi:hypothetical protein ABIC56_002922 [Acinetobacter bereziniae]|uniref:hypothetical protein n=1 Tax=Acinetobacter bereziniae TaxID=106648 RepID=UPI002858245B|nr:hypothetical protein [Acinetobacter bereziniae]MDR6542947.1 hypothetical protein [Acinetobacter bereziniae]